MQENPENPVSTSRQEHEQNSSEDARKKLEAEIADLQACLERERALRHALEFQMSLPRYKLVDTLNSFVGKKVPRLHKIMKAVLLYLIDRRNRRRRGKPGKQPGTDQVLVQRSGPGGSERLNLPFGVNVAGYVRSEKGVGESLRSAVRALQAVQCPYVVNPIEDPGSENIEDIALRMSTDNPYAINLIYLNPDSVPAFRQRRNGYFLDRHNVGCWNWELFSFPKEWNTSFEYFDEIWVPSSFVQDSVARVSPVPVVRIPYPIDPELEIPKGFTRSSFELPLDGFVFFSMFDFQSYAERKNPKGMIRAFKEAFGGSKEAFLLIKCSHSDFDPLALAKLREECRGANIRLYDAVLPRAAVQSLMAICDCYVSLHRVEGFGLPLLEAMSMAKPVIATAYSGNMDFMSPHNSFLVRYRLVEIEEHHGPYRKGWSWADPELDHAAALMRLVCSNREQAAATGRLAREDVIRNLHPALVGNMMRERLVNLNGSTPRMRGQST